MTTIREPIWPEKCPTYVVRCFAPPCPVVPECVDPLEPTESFIDDAPPLLENLGKGLTVFQQLLFAVLLLGLFKNTLEMYASSKKA